MDRIECARANQRLDRAPVDDAPVDARAKIEQIVKRPVLARRPVIAAEDLAFLQGEAPGSEPHWLDGDLPSAIARLETAMIRRALSSCGGNRAEAARKLGIHRQLLYEKMRRYGLDVSGNRTEPVAKADGTGTNA